jgi:archaemetzincin
MNINIELQILPIGEIDDTSLRILVARIGQIYYYVELLKPIKQIESAYNGNRNQYLSDEFLSRVKQLPGDHILGVTNVDLYTPELNFVFGQAQLPGKAAVISLARLRDDKHELYYDRMIKEAVHEIGHTLGLRHCPDVFCVMHFSNSLKETDIKGDYYCQKCEKEIEKFVKKSRH